MERYTISGKKTNNPQIVRHPDFTHPHLIKYAFYSDEKIIMVDSEGNIFYKEKGKLHFIRKLKQLIQESGKIGAIIFDDNDVLIGFETNGLIRLMAEQNYQAEKFNINCGIFSLWKDKQQDIIWIGTDGQGYMPGQKTNIHLLIYCSMNFRSARKGRSALFTLINIILYG